MTYFHRRPSTIIGAKAFHCPVRDGKEWDHLAMVVKRNLSPARFWSVPANSEEACLVVMGSTATDRAERKYVCVVWVHEG